MLENNILSFTPSLEEYNVRKLRKKFRKRKDKSFYIDVNKIANLEGKCCRTGFLSDYLEFQGT